MNIYTFKPTYLYIKQHSITGKLYFGKTTRDPEKYLGSGTHWKRHIKKHGKEHVINLWYCLFFDKETISEFALMFSEQQAIVESKEWLNKMPENGLDGGSNGRPCTEETRKKLSNAAKKQIRSKETIDKTAQANTGSKRSPETRKKIAAAATGRVMTLLICPHCHKSGGVNNMSRWHFDNCKLKMKL